MDLELVLDRAVRGVVAVPRDQEDAARAVDGEGGQEGAELRVAVGTHRAQSEVARADGRAARIELLAEDLELVVDQPAEVVVAVPDDQVTVASTVVLDGGDERDVSRVAVRPHGADPEVVRADLVAGSVESLAEDLRFVVDHAADVVVAVPDDQVRVRRVVVRDVGAEGEEGRGSVGPEVTDPKVVRPDLDSGGVESLTEDLELVVRQRGDVVVSFPDDKVLVRLGVVGHGRIARGVEGAPRASRVTDAEVVGAERRS